MNRSAPHKPTAAEQCGDTGRRWRSEAIRRIEADFMRSADTHLIRIDLPFRTGLTLYLKDESAHPTGSLKHRLARSLFLYALCNAWIGPDTVVVEASSGSTAVSEAYFARMLDLRFVAVVPRGTAAGKIDAIRFYGGEIHCVDDPRSVYAVASNIAQETGGHYLDQFTYAERATDWRGNNNIAESIFEQMSCEEHPIPTWIVCGAGTGGTSATIGRYLRYRRLETQLCVADPERSVFHRHFENRNLHELEGETASCIEGIGRARVELSFLPSVIDRMIPVADAQSLGAMHAISSVLGRRVGGSTGTNIWACIQLFQELEAAGRAGSIVSLICDGGDRYLDTYHSATWLENSRLPWRGHAAKVEAVLRADAAATTRAETEPQLMMNRNTAT